MDTGQSVLRRKLAPRLPAGDFLADLPPLAEPAPDRQLSRALIRALNGCVGLVARADLRAHRSAALAELAEHLDPEGFVALLSQPDGPPGLIALDPQGMAALVEAMTTATLSTRQPAPRRPTRTDAALLADVVDSLLHQRDGGEGAVFRFDRMVRDLRLLDVLVEDGGYDLDLVDFELSAGSVRRAGLLLLALPQPALPDMPDLFAATAPLPFDDAPDPGWQAALEAAVLGAPADLRAVLGRVRMPLAQAMALEPGSALLLPLSQLEEVEVETIDRKPLGRARLGQFRGMRAVRMTVLNGGNAAGKGADGAMPPAGEAPQPVATLDPADEGK